VERNGNSLGVRTGRRGFLARKERQRSREVTKLGRKKKRTNYFNAEITEEETQRAQRRRRKRGRKCGV
jgi:hypothetical protein